MLFSKFKFHLYKLYYIYYSIVISKNLSVISQGIKVHIYINDKLFLKIDAITISNLDLFL